MDKRVVVFAALVAAAGCKKDEDSKPAPKPAPATDKGKTPDPGKKVEAPPPPKAMTGDDRAKRYQECWGFFNARDAKFTGCFEPNATSDVVDSGMPIAVTGGPGVLEQQKPFTDAFPDLSGELQLTLVNDKNVAGIALIRGTHTAALKSPMGEIPPSNKKIGFLMGHVVTFGDKDAVVSQSIYEDLGTLMGQIGASKMPARAALTEGWPAKEVVVAKNDDLEKKNLEADKAYVDTFNKHDAKAAVGMLADDLVWSENASPADMNKAAMAPMLDALWKGFSDVKITPTNVWAAGPYVVLTGTFAGTNDGDMPMMKMKKTGKKVSSSMLQIDRFNKDGKIDRVWIFYNGIAFAQQLGLIPAPAAPAAPDKK